MQRAYLADGGHLTIHQRDPEMAPDSNFEPGELAHLVPGNAGRMLDWRRTPMRVAGLRQETGTWLCEITGFEDRGALWELPFEKVTNFQILKGARRAPASEVGHMREAIARFSAALVIEVDPAHGRATQDTISARRAAAASWLAEHAPEVAALGAHGAAAGTDAAGRLADAHPSAAIDLASRRAPEATLTAFERFMSARGFAEMDAAFARAWVSNPHAGEIVKGHAIVLADLGLARFRGTIVRESATFAGEWSKARRADHVLWRMAMTQVLLKAVGLGEPVLHRGVASNEVIRPRSDESLVAASFSREVAESMFGAPGEARYAVLSRQRVKLERVLMTFVETRALNGPFLEAEAVMIADPENPLF